MAKKSNDRTRKKRQKLVDKFAAKRAALKADSRTQSKPMEERFRARLKAGKTAAQQLGHTLAQPLPADGRPHAYYRKLQISRICSARTRLQRPDSRHGQVKLVRERR